MKKSPPFNLCMVASAVSVMSMLTFSMAHAALVICANPLVSGQDRQYQTTGASDCVWGDGNIGQGGGNDDFLAGNGTNDAAYGDLGSNFGLTWTLIDGENANNQGIQPSLTGLTISNSDANTFDWLLTDVSYGQYALGLKDGGKPKWAVFLLSDTSGTADIISSGGSWSHVALYGNGTPQPPPPPPQEIPEPGSLALLGLGILGLWQTRRKQTAS